MPVVDILSLLPEFCFHILNSWRAYFCLGEGFETAINTKTCFSLSVICFINYWIIRSVYSLFYYLYREFQISKPGKIVLHDRLMIHSVFQMFRKVYLLRQTESCKQDDFVERKLFWNIFHHGCLKFFGRAFFQPSDIHYLFVKDW